MRFEDDVVLEPQELCDLMNYVLGYSVAEMFSRRVEVFVVKTWEVKHGRWRVQRWCEAMLRFHGVLARRKLPGSVGRPPTLLPPSEIRGFCGSTAEVARTVGVDKKMLLRWLWAEKFSRAQAHHINGGQESPNLGPERDLETVVREAAALEALEGLRKAPTEVLAITNAGDERATTSGTLDFACRSFTTVTSPRSRSRARS